jgi:hypothetical protein
LIIKIFPKYVRNRNGPDIETKVNMFADDTQLINKTEEYIEETFKTLEIYEKASGAKMNLEKTVGMYLGKWRNKNPRFKNISHMMEFISFSNFTGIPLISIS